MTAPGGRQVPGSRGKATFTGAVPLALSLFLIVLIGVLDWVTGYELSIALLYFIPLSVAALRVGRGAGVAAALLSALAWYLAEILTGHRYGSPLAIYWNTAVRLGIFLVVSLLITRLRDAAAVERAQREKLEELNQLKNRFVGMAAHDLRSPLAVISIYAGYLLDDRAAALSKRQVRFLTVILDKTTHMLEMINDLLDITRIESGRIDLDLREQDWGAFVSEVASLAGVIAEKRGLSIRLDVEEGITPLRFDRARMEQVLNNLLMNALKYSPPGASVSVRVAREGDRVVTEVADTGPGIPAGEQGLLFIEFSKTSVLPAGGERGTGLGLAIARKMVEGHGGWIGVRSAVGEGSTFWFTLPAGGA